VKRLAVAIEGLATMDGRLILEGALTWPDEVPVQEPGGSPIIGVATDFRREANGYVTALISMEDGEVADDVTPSLNVRDVELVDGDVAFTVSAGEVVGVVLLPGHMNAWRELCRPPAPVVKAGRREWQVLNDDGSVAALWTEDEAHFTPEKIQGHAANWYPGKPLVIVQHYTETRPA
jgi:hypothetical protein